jgi:hypothetical protein
MDIKHYREAYDGFNKVMARKVDYKDAKVKSKECIEKGTYTIALLPFENATSSTGLDAKVSAYTLEALTSINDPFLRIVDREHIQAICDQHGINWYPLSYTKKPPLLSTIYDVQRMKRLAHRLHIEHSFKIIHCRSYISALVGLGMKKRFGTKFLLSDENNSNGHPHQT